VNGNTIPIQKLPAVIELPDESTRTSMSEPQSSTLTPPLDDVLNLYFHRLESTMNNTGEILAAGKKERILFTI
jgi:hypothetical protein